MGREANEVVIVSLELLAAVRLASLLRHKMGISQVHAAELDIPRLRRHEKPELKQNQSEGLSVLLHVFEGRTLLVDKDGLCTTWFCCMARRNVVLALQGIETPDDGVMCVELVGSRQNSVLALHRVGRFWTWRHESSRAHLARSRVRRKGLSFPYFEPTPEIMVFDSHTLPEGVSSKTSLATSIQTKFMQNAYTAKIAKMPILSTLSRSFYNLPIQTKHAARDTATTMDLADFEDLGGELEHLRDKGDGAQQHDKMAAAIAVQRTRFM